MSLPSPGPTSRPASRSRKNSNTSILLTMMSIKEATRRRELIRRLSITATKTNHRSYGATRETFNSTARTMLCSLMSLPNKIPLASEKVQNPDPLSDKIRWMTTGTKAIHPTRKRRGMGLLSPAPR